MPIPSKPWGDSRARDSVRKWFESPLGEALKTLEAQYLSDCLDLSYRQTGLQIGELGWESQFLKQDLYPNYVILDRGSSLPHDFRTVIAHPHELPFAAESADVLIVPHFLEFESQPLRPLLFREADRVLKSEGRMVLLLFNAFSGYQLLKLIPGLRKLAPTPTGFVTLFHLLHWMSPYNFTIESTAQFCLPLDRTLTNRSAVRQVAAGFLVIAYAVRIVKRSYTLIPLAERKPRLSILEPVNAAGSTPTRQVILHA